MLHAADLEARAARIPRLDLIELDPSEYRIGPRDLLEVDIYELEAPTETKRLKVRVSQTGSILLPLIGAVPAVGQTATELQKAIAAKLQKDFIFNPSVNVLIAEFKARRVTVLGEVHTPGTFELTENSTTLINALALAGSPNEKAGTRAFILRARRRSAVATGAPAPVSPAPVSPAPVAPAPGGAAPLPAAPQDHKKGAALAKQIEKDLGDRLIEVDLTELITNGNMAFNYALQDGDLVHIPKAAMCFVTGLVHNPGAFPVKDKVTILRAVALAGGAREYVTPAMTVLLRVTETGPQSDPDRSGERHEWIRERP